MLKFIISSIIGSIILYLLGYFLSNQPNPLLWPVYGKIFYLIFEFGIIKSSLEF